MNFKFCLLLPLLFGLVTKARAQPLAISGATIHVGNGRVIQNGLLVLNEGKIIHIDSAADASKFKNARVIDARGKHVYPALMALNTFAGLNEIDAVKPTRDYEETGRFNPNIRSAIAYNCDSRILPTLSCNGVLLVQPVPRGGLVSGSSSLMKTSCSNWEDALYAADNALHVFWPELKVAAEGEEGSRLRRELEKNLQQLEELFKQAQVYATEGNMAYDLKLEALKGLFTGSKKLFVHSDRAQSIIDAVLFFKQFGLPVVWVGAAEAASIIPFIQQEKLSLVLGNVHSLPLNGQQRMDAPYRLPALLDSCAIPFCLSVPGSWEVRNLPFTAGTAAAYGLSREKALEAISLQVARTLGIEKTCGSLETGKDANLLISDGDLLDMRSCRISLALLKGKEVPLDENPQLLLYKKYQEKYRGQ